MQTSALPPEHERVHAAARDWLAADRPAVVVEVVRVQGSAPRGPGTRMLVAAGDTAGTIGGGHLEWQAIAQAREALAAHGLAFEPWSQNFALGPSLGQCCGGSVKLNFFPLGSDMVTDWPPPQPRFHLQLYGAGHVGRAVIQLLAGLPCRVQWIDQREEAFPSLALPKHIQRVCVDTVEAEVAQAPPGSSYLVMTHQHDLDLRIAQAILQRGDVRWFGLIGSRTKRARFEHRLAERGIPEHRIAQMICPVGRPDIQGKEPEVIAISVAAQILAAHPLTP